MNNQIYRWCRGKRKPKNKKARRKEFIIAILERSNHGSAFAEALLEQFCP
jgi:hypothetical protein